MKVVKCDCCGKELVGRIFKFAFEIEDEFGNIISEQEADKEWQERQGNVDDKDYCFECAKSISKMTFSQTCEESQEPKEEISNPKPQKKKDLDWGKACALKTAGSMSIFSSSLGNKLSSTTSMLYNKCSCVISWWS